MTTTTNETLRRRQSKPTIQIPARTISECAARYAAVRACQQLGLPVDEIELER